MKKKILENIITTLRMSCEWLMGNDSDSSDYDDIVLPSLRKLNEYLATQDYPLMVEYDSLELTLHKLKEIENKIDSFQFESEPTEKVPQVNPMENLADYDISVLTRQSRMFQFMQEIEIGQFEDIKLFWLSQQEDLLASHNYNLNSIIFLNNDTLFIFGNSLFFQDTVMYDKAVLIALDKLKQKFNLSKGQLILSKANCCII